MHRLWISCSRFHPNTYFHIWFKFCVGYFASILICVLVYDIPQSYVDYSFYWRLWSSKTLVHASLFLELDSLKYSSHHGMTRKFGQFYSWNKTILNIPVVVEWPASSVGVLLFLIVLIIQSLLLLWYYYVYFMSCIESWKSLYILHLYLVRFVSHCVFSSCGAGSSK